VPSHFPFGDELAAVAHWCAPSLLIAASVFMSGTAGCSHKTVHAAVPKPVPPAPHQVTLPAPPDVRDSEPSDVELAFLTVPLPAPPPGHNAHPAPPVHRASSDSSSSSRPAPPQISPQISQADQAATEKRTNDGIKEAEKNLQQAASHQLSSSQQEMVEKIRGFINQAREALQDADYTRAQNLAQKAQLLSVELVNTL